MNKPRVFVTRRIPEAGLGKIQAVCEVDLWDDEMPPPYEILTQKVRGIDGLLCLLTDRIDDPLMEAAGAQLKVISQMAVGYDNIDIAAAARRGIPVGNTPGVLTDATADLTMALLLATARRIVESAQYIKDGKWQTWGPQTLLGADLKGSTLGIVGFGRIGQAVAQRCIGFEMQMLAYDPNAAPQDAARLQVQLVDFDELLRQADFVTLHVPLTDQTRHLINAQTLAKMKRSAILINTSRGGVVDQAALYDALKHGVIGAAGLDVTDPEPIPLSDPLLTLPNAIILPHIGSASRRTRDLMASMAADNLLAGLRDEPLPNQVR